MGLENVPQKSTYVLLPRIEDLVERIEWRIAAAIGCADRMWAVGHVGDSAAAGPRDREVIAINAAAWGLNLQEWYAAHYLNVRYRQVETTSPWEMAVHLMPPLTGDIALAQTDPRWAHYDFGEQPERGGTIRRYGCFMTGLAIILRKIYGRDVTPPVLDKLLVQAGVAFVSDNLLMWQNVVPLFPVFSESIKDNVQRSAGQLRDLLRNGWEVILRQASPEHFVYLEAVEGNVLRIIDTWDGLRKTKSASDYQGIRAARVRPGAIPARPQVLPGERHTYVLLPQIPGASERLRWRMAAAVGAAGQMGAFGHSIDEAGGKAGEQQEVIMVNPGAGVTYPPGARYTTIKTTSPWEMAVQLVPPLDGRSIALSQTDPRWANAYFGEQPGERGETIGQYGSFLVSLAIALRKVYGRDLTPLTLDRLLVAARKAYDAGNLLMWGNAVSLFPIFDDSIKDYRVYSASELARLLRDHWEVILRRADDGRFAYLEAMDGGALRVIDPRDGMRKTKTVAEYRGVRAAHVRQAAAPSYPLLIGLHDRRGGEWMAAQGIRGCCLVHYLVQRQPVQVDYRYLANAGITVLCRLTWGYADGSGTLPRPEDKGAFVNAVVQTMLGARGVAYFHVGNEPNNRQEWPGFGRGNEFALTPQYVVQVYNEIWSQVAGRGEPTARPLLGPPPLDPYFGPGSDNGEWWQYILEHITGADALFLHAKTQTNDPAEVWSRARFSHEPLTWQYLHLRTVETSLAAVPERFRTLPVFVTEVNPQHLDRIGGVFGWRHDNARWVHEAVRYFREERPVAGVVFYRYERVGDQAPFGLEDKPAILAAIKEEATRV